jgi:hypothetical protein
MTRGTHSPSPARKILPSIAAVAGFLLMPGASAPLGGQVPEAAAPAAAHVTIVLPPVLVAGQPATLAVLDAQGRPVAHATVTLTGDVTLTTDATGRAALTAPNAQGVLRAALPHGTATASATVIAAPVEKPTGLRIDTVPRLLLLHDRFTIRGGGFRGIADENRVQLAGQTAAVLAASPAALVALPNPGTALGETKLDVEAAGLSASTAPVTVISLELIADKARGQPGEKGEIHVKVRGTGQPVDFEVRAGPEGRIELAHGNPSRGRTSGGADNGAAIPFTFRQRGEFFVEVRPVTQPLGLPDTDAARRELEQALRLAPPEWTKRVDRVLNLLVRHPQDVTQARDAIEKMLAKKPEGDFGLHLEAAWKILLNRE